MTFFFFSKEKEREAKGRRGEIFFSSHEIRPLSLFLSSFVPFDRERTRVNQLLEAEEARGLREECGPTRRPSTDTPRWNAPCHTSRNVFFSLPRDLSRGRRISERSFKVVRQRVARRRDARKMLGNSRRESLVFSLPSPFFTLPSLFARSRKYHLGVSR